MRTYVAKRGSEDIAYLLFAVIFMNGFETAGTRQRSWQSATPMG